MNVLPCPCCGGKAEAECFIQDARVRCTQCHLKQVVMHDIGSCEDGLPRAIKLWNRRSYDETKYQMVPREPTDDMLDALRGWGEGPLPAKLRWEKALRIAADTFPVAAAPKRD